MADRTSACHLFGFVLEQARADWFDGDILGIKLRVHRILVEFLLYWRRLIDDHQSIFDGSRQRQAI